MLDLIGLALLAKHAHRVAEAKDQRPSTVVLSTIVVYVGVEVLGGLKGFSWAGLQGAAVGAFAGAVLAGTAILLFLHFGLTDKRALAQGPISRTGQLVGEACAVCNEVIASAIGAGRCPLCDAPCHKDCSSRHVKRAHGKKGKRRAQERA